MKKLNIAVFVASETPFPIPKDFPRLYAPLDVALAIAEGLSEKGHKVAFFGPKGSKSKKFKVVALNFTPLYKNDILKLPYIRSVEREKIFNLFDQYCVAHLFREHLKKGFDIIHIHPVDRALPFGFIFRDVPIVYTLHDPVYEWRKRVFKLFQTKNQYFVAISKNQKKSARGLNWAGVIYNGMDLKKFPFSSQKENYCLFFGRLLPKKGVYEAIQAAKRAKEKLLIIGSKDDGKYFEKKIQPYLGKNIKYVGKLPREELAKYIKRAKVSLMPIQWEEPFGLTFIESMACGTPVIAFDRGSAREVIKDGKTGFVVKNVSEMAKAIKKINQIKREDCRKWVEENFTTQRMVLEYEKLYCRLLKK